MNKSRTIFVVDDETTLREVVRRYLEHEGFKVLEAENGTQALTMLRENRTDLIILDIMLPGLDGFSIVRSIRSTPEYTTLQTEGDIPIILLTARGSEPDRIAGYELGIDDYIVKPFSPRELVARVKAVLRRVYPDDTPAEKPLVYPTIQIDPLRRVVTINQQVVTLTTKEFDLLWLMARSPQQVFTREQLLNKVWGYEYYGDESTVTVHMRRLREKIEVDPSNPVYLQTVWGLGYKFEPA